MNDRRGEVVMRGMEQEEEEEESSPELGSQGSMSSSSLGHSADATSRSSADCGRQKDCVSV